MTGTLGYMEIAEHFRARIKDGTLKPGDRLPTLREVIQEHGVSNVTAVRAYKVLKAEGLTSANSGSGTVVAEKRWIIAGATRIQGITRSGETVPYLRSSRAQAPEWVAEYLGDGECVNRSRTVNRGEVVLQASQSWISPEIADTVPEIDGDAPCKPTWQAMYQKRSGDQVHVASKTVTARLTTPEERDIFGLYEDAAVVVLRSIYTLEGNVIGIGEGVYAPGHPLDVA